MAMILLARKTIARIWNQAKCPTTDDWKKLWLIYKMDYYVVSKENKAMRFVATWIALECVVLSKISQRHDKYKMVSLICNIKGNKVKGMDNTN